MKNHTRFIVCCSLVMFAFRASKAVRHYDGQYIPLHSLAILTRVTGGPTHRGKRSTPSVLPVYLTCMFFVGEGGIVGRNGSTKEESHAGTERTCKSHTQKKRPQTVSRVKAQTLWLWGASADNCTTTLPLEYIIFTLIYTESYTFPNIHIYKGAVKTVTKHFIF